MHGHAGKDARTLWKHNVPATMLAEAKKTNWIKNQNTGNYKFLVYSKLKQHW